MIKSIDKINWSNQSIKSIDQIKYDQIKYDQIIYKQHIITNQVLFALFAETKNIRVLDDVGIQKVGNDVEIQNVKDINSTIEETLEGNVSGILIIIITGICSSDNL